MFPPLPKKPGTLFYAPALRFFLAIHATVWHNSIGTGDVPKWLKGPDSKSGRRRKACGGSNPSISASSEIPATVPFPPYGESYTLAGISSLSSDKRFTGLPDEEIGCDSKIPY